MSTREEAVKVLSNRTECRGGHVRYRYRFGERPLDGYTIRRGIGQGGFGEVYFAVSDGGREVALKSILRNEEVELRGVRQCINLKSPQLVSVFDVRQAADGATFVIMEYMTGPSLRELLREHPRGLGPEEATHLIKEIGKGLSCLHDHGIVHRDLKPENIFYEDGHAKIGDYGLAKLLSASRQSGQTMSVGTVHYMAPEIGSGNYQRGVDIYSLGVILHELLTGTVPFDGDSFGEILMKHLTSDPDLSALAEPFRSVVAGALIKDPAERFQSIDDMLAPLLCREPGRGDLATLHPRSLSSFVRSTGSVASRGEPTLGLPTAPGAATVGAAAVVPRVEAGNSTTKNSTTRDSVVAMPANEVAATGNARGSSGLGTAPLRIASAWRGFGVSAAQALAWFTAETLRLLARVGESALVAVCALARGIGRTVTAPFRSGAARGDSPPGRPTPSGRQLVTRLFWALVSSAIFAVGVCCMIAACFHFGPYREEESFVLGGIGLALAVFGRRMLTIVSR